LFLLLLFILQIFVSSEEADTGGMVPPDGEEVASEEKIDAEEIPVEDEEMVDAETSEDVGEAETFEDVGDAETYEDVGDAETFEDVDDGTFDDEGVFDDAEDKLGDGDDDGLDGMDLQDLLDHYDIDLDDFDEEDLATMMEQMYEGRFEPYNDGYGEVAVGAEYEDAAVYLDGEEQTVGDYGDEFEYEIAYNPEDWEEAEGEWEFDESMDIEISEGDLLNIDYCEHFTAPEDGVSKMNVERCEEVESAFCDCESRPDFYYTPEQCLMLKYQFSFDYLMQDCCLDETVENNLCSDYMEALALCECHPDEGECTEDEMMEDCDYLWDESMHMCRNITAVENWPVCEDMIKEDLRTELR